MSHFCEDLRLMMKETLPQSDDAVAASIAEAARKAQEEGESGASEELLAFDYLAGGGGGGQGGKVTKKERSLPHAIKCAFNSIIETVQVW
jgi:hypothetical protein